ncbi:MAG: type 2 isopentenyl-diphosphate Delta-isomerase [Planctomycetota bacterium]|nr:MAG: type 2 isopentenyl-diphosphate Delta-isomerase [Planctomycetota bacterium]
MNRKNEHLQICLNEDVQAQHTTTGLEEYTLEYDALPELDFEEISLETKFLGKTLSAPLMIGAMTGGTPQAAEFNKRLAQAAAEIGIAMALGSQRPMLQNPEDESFMVKKYAPKLKLLLGNLGAVQLNYGVQPSQIREILEKTQCDALNFHLNPLQEAIQPEGDKNFKNLLSKLHQTIDELPYPVLIKEVGCGISTTTALKLKTLPIAGVEVAGVGGTSWAFIEAMRNQDPIAKTTGVHLKEFGVPTAQSIQICRKIFPEKYVVASGGLRTGLDIAKALALGADIAAFALPALKAAETHEILQFLNQIVYELKTILFITGSANVRSLRGKIFKK